MDGEKHWTKTRASFRVDGDRWCTNPSPAVLQAAEHPSSGGNAPTLAAWIQICHKQTSISAPGTLQGHWNAKLSVVWLGAKCFPSPPDMQHLHAFALLRYWASRLRAGPSSVFKVPICHLVSMWLPLWHLVQRCPSLSNWVYNSLYI